MKLVTLVLLGLCVGAVLCERPFRITIFDVGQGDSQLIQFPSGFTILVDVAETAWNSHVGADKVADRIKMLTGGTHINVGVISHLHLDHLGYVGYGGFWGLIETHNITFDKIVDRNAGSWVDLNMDGECDYEKEIVWSNVGAPSNTARKWLCYATDPRNERIYPVREIARLCNTTQIHVPDANATVTIVSVDGEGFTLDDGTPMSGDHSNMELPPSENDFSVGILVEFKGLRYVTCGDVDGEYGAGATHTYNDVEKVIANRVGEVDIYHVDHHGSRHSSSSYWLNTLRPTVSVCSCGTDNDYGHPGQIVIDRTLQHGDLYLTELCDQSRDYHDAKRNIGDISIESFDGKMFTVQNSQDPNDRTVYEVKQVHQAGYCKV